MINQCVVVGRLAKKTKENDKIYIEIKVQRPFKNKNGEYEDDLITCLVNCNMSSTLEEYCNIGDIIGVKGHLELENNKMIVKVVKMTFLGGK